MSVRIMAEVFDRYPGGGTELLLALAIADHAHDDGTHVYPSVKRLAEKTRQSERSVQYHLRKMEADGWLLLVREAVGGRGAGMPREYRISPAWIKGADFSSPAEMGAKADTKGCSQEQERVQTEAEMGAVAIAPEPSINHQEKHQEKGRKRAGRVTIPLPEWVPAEAWDAWLDMRAKARIPTTERALELALRDLSKFRDQGHDPRAVLEQSVTRGWRGLFAPRKDWGNSHGASSSGRRESTAERVERINREHDERERRQFAG